MADEKVRTSAPEPIRSEPLPLEFPGIHHMGDEEVEAALRVLRARSPFRYYGIKLQREVESFEAEFCSFLGASHAVAVSSGTGALHTGLSALGVGPGQEVIIPAYLWVSVAAAVVNLGAIPVVTDIDQTFGLDPKEVERNITPKTTGIVAVHMSGAPADIGALLPIARKHGLFVLEDCAQCLGGSFQGKKTGTLGDVGVFSFQMNKNMTAGEGGCVVTNDSQLYRRAFACHDLGYVRDESGRLVFDNPDLSLWGRGYRLDELRGAILRAQLKKLPHIVERMRRSKYRIREEIQGLQGLRLRRIVDTAGDTGAFLITSYSDAERARAVKRSMRDLGISTFPQGASNIVMTEWGLHLYYNIVSLVRRSSIDRSGFPWNLAENAGLGRSYAKGSCPVADSLFERSILLPIPSCLTEQDEQDIINAFRRVLG